MNNAALNGSSVNGSLIGTIAGSGQALMVLSFSADATKTQYAQATMAETPLVASASGLRTVFGQGAAVSALVGSAQWALLSQSGGIAVMGGTFTATNTDAYAQCRASASADGTIIRPGAGLAPAVFAAQAIPLLTAAGAGTCAPVFTGSADASVKLNGQSTIQRDGYPRAMAFNAGFTADALRTAYSGGQGLQVTSASANALLTQGAQALLTLNFSASALAAKDYAAATFTTTFTADALVTQFGNAQLVVSPAISAAQTVLTQGTSIPAVISFGLTADGRLAQRGGASLSFALAGRADARLAYQASAASTFSSDAQADATRVVPADGAMATAGVFSADWIILRDGSAFMQASLAVSATGWTNAEALDPPERTMTRPFVDREVMRPFIDREMRRQP